MKTRAIATIFVLAGLCVVGRGQAPNSAHAEGRQDTPKLPGTWLVAVTRTSPPSPASFLSMQTYSGDGAVLEESNNPIVPRSLAQGLWVKTGPRQFRRTWVYFRFDSFTLPRTFIGTSNNVATLTLTEDGSEFYAEAIVELRDAVGVFEATRTFSELGRRF
jgi:hypothetical protein